jgi:hypothetical protein|tara:strand:+ start:769 stop:1044 length:276 start_codon:yes stop_codon:yes gene_type:complete
MSVEILTKEDLNNFKVELVNLITEIISKGQPQKKEILSNEDVKDLLGISSGTLRKYRITGKISYTKIDNILYYKYDDVIKLIDSNRLKSLS